MSGRTFGNQYQDAVSAEDVKRVRPLVAEAWPASKRARVSSYVGLGWQLGVLAAAIVTPLLLPVIGWRGMFAIGILPGDCGLFHPAFKLHEPDVFVANAPPTRSEATSLPLAACWSRTPNHQDQHRHDHSLLGAEFRLLRRDDLAAELSRRRFGFGLTNRRPGPP
jgi:MFS family permease